MKLLVLSDLHLEFARFDVPEHIAFDVAVLAGDIASPGSDAVRWARRSPALRRAKAVVLVPGNHEYYGGEMLREFAAMRLEARVFDGRSGNDNHAGSEGDRGSDSSDDSDSDSDTPPIHVLDGDDIVIDGVRFLGCTLWTDFALRIDTPLGPRQDVARGIAAARRSMVDYRAIKLQARQLTPEDTLDFHHQQLAWLTQALAAPFSGATVVVTHHAPHRGSLAAKYAGDWVSTAFINELPAELFEVPALWVHGHTHSGCDYRVGGCRVLCNPRGYVIGRDALPENAGFDPACIVEV
jgi:predicted phosphodiesterase